MKITICLASKSKLEENNCNNTLPRGGVYWKIRPLRAEGCKLPRGAYFPIHPNSRQCIAILFSRAGVYWKLPFKQPGLLTVYKFNALPLYKKECKLLLSCSHALVK